MFRKVPGREADEKITSLFRRELMSLGVFSIMISGIFEYFSLTGLVNQTIAKIVLIFVWLIGSLGVLHAQVHAQAWRRLPLMVRVQNGAIGSIAIGVILISINVAVAQIKGNDATASAPLPTAPAPTDTKNTISGGHNTLTSSGSSTFGGQQVIQGNIINNTGDSGLNSVQPQEKLKAYHEDCVNKIDIGHNVVNQADPSTVLPVFSIPTESIAEISRVSVAPDFNKNFLKELNDYSSISHAYQMSMLARLKVKTMQNASKNSPMASNPQYLAGVARLEAPDIEASTGERDPAKLGAEAIKKLMAVCDILR